VTTSTQFSSFILIELADHVTISTQGALIQSFDISTQGALIDQLHEVSKRTLTNTHILNMFFIIKKLKIKV